MKDKFVEWYGIVCPNPSNEQLKNRWDSLQKYCQKENINIKKLSTLFFGLPTDQDFINDFAEVYQNVDMTFSKKNYRELSLLAGVTLLQLLESDEYATEIALAIIILSVYDQEVILPEVLDIAAEKLRDITANTRELIQENELKKLSSIGVDQLKKSNPENGWTPDVAEKLLSLLTKVSNNFTAINNNQIELANALRIYKEDSNILSWLVGEWSNDLNKPLTKAIKGNEIALILGKELADLIETVPGPFAAKAFLKKMLKLCKVDNSKSSLIDMVDLLDKEWKTKLFENNELIETGVNTPTLLGISKSLETDEPKVWKTFFEKITNINPESIQRDTLEWAYQIYLECLLVIWYNGEE
jgi:hypothetical protein